MAGLRVTILGCGTSGGVPRADGEWGVCDPAEPRNRRRRASILVQSATTSVIVDTSPDLREQCLSAGLSKIDAVLYTHEHADHIMGIDDLRAFMIRHRHRVPVYGDAATMAMLNRRFDYIFRGERGYPAICQGHVIDGEVRVGDIVATPFRQVHGDIGSLGFRFGNMAYSTDLKEIPEESKPLLRDLDLWIVDALRPEPHPTHSHLDQTLEWIEEFRPKRAVLTHMTWQLDYNELKARLPDHIEPAYDGLVLDF